ncbi:MAG: type IV pilus secretin PilQ [candidate division Zixibacteria bacterium]|nr:type IV pilus secretin PilQ [candidate division Zixibacteria bacterium]
MSPSRNRRWLAQAPFIGWALMTGISALIVLAPLTVGAEAIKNVNFQNADVRSVLNFLAEYGGVNVVAAPTVQGQVTLNLKNVEWRQALEILAKTYGLKVVDEAGYIRVLLLVDFVKEESDRERHASDQRQMVDLETKTIDIKFASARDLIKPIKSVLSGRGKVDVDERTNTLLVTDEPGNVARVKELVAGLDRETRQVKISAKLMEVASEYLDEMGISWNTFTTGVSHDRQYTNELNANGAGRVADPFASYKFSTLQHGWNMDATISAIISSGKGKIIAHPEIITVDNKEARIQMGQKVPIKQFSATGDIVITFEEVGTILRVTPHITSEDRILLYMKPERSSYAFDPNGVIINTNNAETNVVVANGQTAIIGGLTSQEEVVNRVGLPILKDIPILGKIFSYEKKDVKSRDLVIFVTPQIVDAAMMGSTESGK